MAETQVRKPKLRDLPLEERLEGYLQIEYQKALDDFILMLGMPEATRRNWRCPDWISIYSGFLTRILKEHGGTEKFPGLSEFVEQLKASGIKCEMGKEPTPCGFDMRHADCVQFSVGQVMFSMVYLDFDHHLSVEHSVSIYDCKALRLPAHELIDSIRLTVPFIQRIRELAVEAERQASAVAMARKIRRITKKRAALQESEDTGV